MLRWLGERRGLHRSRVTHLQAEDSTRVAAAIADALTTLHDDWDRIDLKAVDADDAAIGHLLAAFEERECVVSRSAADACWAVELAATWDDYLAGISKSHRKQLRQLERRVLESDRVSWHRVQSAAELGCCLDRAGRLASTAPTRAWANRAASHRGRFSTSTAKSSTGCSARANYGCRGWRLDGPPAAAEYHLADSRATYAYQGGVDPDRLDEEPGRLSTILCMRQAIDEGHKQFDFLRGDEPYKAHWRATPRATFDYRVVPNRRLARLRGRVSNVAGTLTDLARQGAQFVSFASGSMS